MISHFSATALLAALTVVAIQLNLTPWNYILGIATAALLIDSVLRFSKKTAKKGWSEKVKPRLKKEYQDFDAAKPNYPKGKLVEYGKKVADNVGRDMTASEAEQYRVKKGGLVNALTDASKAFFSELDKILKK